MSDLEPTFETLVAEAERAAFSGWDFSYLRGRMVEGGTPWRYADRVRARLMGLPALLDLGTGGGEFLATLAPLPPSTVATEGYPPNVDVARKRLALLGVEVVAVNGAPDFSVARYRDRLEALHRRIAAAGGLHVRQHLFYLEGVKP
jgi:tRNA G46 methylase TrmB